MNTSPGLNQAPGFSESAATPAHRRLYRSRTNRVFAGVCAGVADHFRADPTAVRLLTVMIAVFTALVPMCVLYLVAAIIIPERAGGDDPEDTAGAGVSGWAMPAGVVLGILLVLAGVLALANELFRIDWNVLWPAGLIVLGGALVLAAQRR